MGCIKLIKGHDIGCDSIYTKYYQNIVLINKPDVKDFFIDSSNTRNRINFNLKPGLKGYLFRGPEVGSALSASFSKTTVKGIPLYTHNIKLPVVGASEDSKTLLKQLDSGDFFAAIHFKSGEVEIYGFNYGLTTQDYDYQLQSTAGGASIPMKSAYREYDPPYVFLPNVKQVDPGSSVSQKAIEDFDNLFLDLTEIFTGDFNDDFNNDFNIDTP